MVDVSLEALRKLMTTNVDQQQAVERKQTVPVTDVDVDADMATKLDSAVSPAVVGDIVGRTTYKTKSIRNLFRDKHDVVVTSLPKEPPSKPMTRKEQLIESYKKSMTSK